MSDQSLPVAEAAARAAANYVWNESHKKGVQAGWAAGWADAMAELSAGLPPSPSPPSGTAAPCEPEHQATESPSKEPQFQFELDSEWAELFMKGAARRVAERRADDIESAKRRRVALDLGGAAEAAHRDKAKQLYGDEATRILETEAELAANFDALVASSKANVWPVLSIREGEAPRNKKR